MIILYVQRYRRFRECVDRNFSILYRTTGNLSNAAHGYFLSGLAICYPRIKKDILTLRKLGERTVLLSVDARESFKMFAMFRKMLANRGFPGYITNDLGKVYDAWRALGTSMNGTVCGGRLFSCRDSMHHFQER